MKKSLIKLFSLLAFSFGVMTFQSCDPDACKDIVCLNGGICFEGTCLCEAGFSGTDCASEQRTIFYGNYDNAEVCTSAPTFTDNYIMPITAKSGEDKTAFYVENLYNLENNQNPVAKADCDLVVNVTGDTTFDFVGQALTGNASHLRIEPVAGEVGTITGTQVTFRYILVDTSVSPNFRDTCSAVLSPR